ncbi:MAG: glycosyltransferase family A protein [Rhodocyclaceae bacterium]|jgi:glycosyltransferase involved in cell wall biosynthesis|nr:glycosyltransferase family A protein [Rhodocyclaceae bacterium]
MTRTTDPGPTVSVVIPAYNAAWCVARAIDSVLAQGFQDLELIVVNDGSTDDTSKVLAGYGAALKTIEQPNGGLSNARNSGIQAARGRYVALLDADDWWLPGKLAGQVALMEACPALVFCSTSAKLEAPDGTRLGEWRGRNAPLSTLEAIFAENAFVAGSGSAVLVRRDALIQAGGFDETLRSLEDIDMWMRLAAIGGYACLDEPLAVILKRPDSMSGNLAVMRDAARRVMRKNRHLLPPAKRGAFWRQAYAGMLSDYAKWAWRSGQRRAALRDVTLALSLAPLARGRLLLGLLAAMLLNRAL